MSKYVIGVDGGGTHTKSILVRDDGQVLGTIASGAANFQQLGVEGVKKVCQDILTEMGKKFYLSATQIACWGVGLAGAGREHDRRIVVETIEALGFAGRVIVQSDAYVALTGAFLGKPGIVLICGTGSMSIGMNQKGEIARTGGWGYLLGDEGSGYDIGRRALVAALKDFDQRGSRTRLRSKLERYFGIATIDQIIPKIYSKEIGKDQIAALAPIVFETASEGDLVAANIIDTVIVDMASLILSVAKKLGFHEETPLVVACSGSVFNQKDVLFPKLSAQVATVYPNVSISQPRFEPVVGAAIMALEKIGIQPTEDVLDNLSRFNK